MSPSALLELEERAEALIPLGAARALVDEVYAMNVSGWEDEHFAALERVIDKAIQLLGASPSADHRPLIERLLIAREGVEQGMAPDPQKRPTMAEVRAYVSERLGR